MAEKKQIRSWWSWLTGGRVRGKHKNPEDSELEYRQGSGKEETSMAGKLRWSPGPIGKPSHRERPPEWPVVSVCWTWFDLPKTLLEAQLMQDSVDHWNDMLYDPGQYRGSTFDAHAM